MGEPEIATSQAAVEGHLKYLSRRNAPYDSNAIGCSVHVLTVKMPDL